VDEKYPKIKVKLTGEDGNAFAIISRVRSALCKGKVSDEEIAAFTKEAESGNYDNVLQTCMRWVKCR
jgi:hypothetical protein